MKMKAKPVPKSIKTKIAKFRVMANALRKGDEPWGIAVTRLTTLKSLCRDHQAASHFALFLTERSLEQLAESDKLGQYALVERVVEKMRHYLTDPTPDVQAELGRFLTQLRQSQNDYQRQGWNTVRIIHSASLLVVEYCLQVLLYPDQAPQAAYYAARHYAERYDPSCMAGLTPESAPLLEDIARFWYDYYGLASP